MGHGAILEALADPTRRHIFELLRPGPRAVGEIAGRMPVSRPAVSQHLKVLKTAGLVDERRDGTRRLYSIRPAGVEELRAYADRMWTDAMDAFAEAAGRRTGRTGGKDGS